jgi:hypothetical protein
MDRPPESLFDVDTRLGFRVRVPASRWELIVTSKHPAMRGRQREVEQAIDDPDEIRESNSDAEVFLFYKLQRPGRWICAVARRVDATDGFLITAYPTDAVKEGRRIWIR